MHRPGCLVEYYLPHIWTLVQISDTPDSDGLTFRSDRVIIVIKFIKMWLKTSLQLKIDN